MAIVGGALAVMQHKNGYSNGINDLLDIRWYECAIMFNRIYIYMDI